MPPPVHFPGPRVAHGEPQDGILRGEGDERDVLELGGVGVRGLLHDDGVAAVEGDGGGVGASFVGSVGDERAVEGRLAVATGHQRAGGANGEVSQELEPLTGALTNRAEAKSGLGSSFSSPRYPRPDRTYGRAGYQRKVLYYVCSL